MPRITVRNWLPLLIVSLAWLYGWPVIHFHFLVFLFHFHLFQLINIFQILNPPSFFSRCFQLSTLSLWLYIYENFERRHAHVLKLLVISWNWSSDLKTCYRLYLPCPSGLFHLDMFLCARTPMFILWFQSVEPVYCFIWWWLSRYVTLIWDWAIYHFQYRSSDSFPWNGNSLHPLFVEAIYITSQALF